LRAFQKAVNVSFYRALQKDSEAESMKALLDFFKRITNQGFKALKNN
jgi:hypothetical protein